MFMRETAIPAPIADGRVVRHRPHLHALPCYTVHDDALAMGASLGNSALWVTTRSTGAVERLFSIELGQSLVGMIALRYAGTGVPLPTEEQGDSSPVAAPPCADLSQIAPGTFELHPAYQRHHLTLAGAIDVRETTFVPLTGEDDLPVLYQVVELHNGGRSTQHLRVLGFAHLCGTLATDVQARYDPDLQALVAHNASRPDAVRIFGLTEPPSGYATSADFGRVYDPRHVGALENVTEERGDILGCLQLDVALAPGQRREFAFITALSAQGEEAAILTYQDAHGYAGALDCTLEYLDEVLARCQVLTPDPLIDQGVLWSKVNMLRVMARYPQGPAFTNEPGVSSNVVARDVAWYVYGNDHFLPHFSRAMLDTLARLQDADGKIPEYYDALDGHVEDYGLNINDDTPLFILAVNHHFRTTGDVAWLRGIYPAVVKAARHIIAQEDERGLVCCTARDPRGNVWAIASWRNVIPGYTLNGAVTEINAACAAALRATGHLAREQGLPHAQAQEFFAAALALRDAINTHLLNPANGLYYLTIDADGRVHTDVTGDEVFPVIFGVCDEETGFRIVSRLNAPDFWTDAGLRTASRHDPRYDPSAHVGLIGGVWPGLTWWYAFAAARYYPEAMVRALRASFAHYAADPKTNHTVPGQFSEWFDGESLVNRGMRLSPWEPPRFLRAAVEGVCGLMLTPEQPSVAPLVPPSWKWVALRRLPYQGREVSYVALRQGDQFHLYATCEVQTTYPAEVYSEDVSSQVQAPSPSAMVVALRRADELLIVVGNAGTQTSIVPVNLSDLVDPAATYDVHLYNSERGAWEPERREQGSMVGFLPISIEAGGYRALTLRPAKA
jgi:hypothetical protein